MVVMVRGGINVKGAKNLQEQEHLAPSNPLSIFIYLSLSLSHLNPSHCTDLKEIMIGFTKLDLPIDGLFWLCLGKGSVIFQSTNLN